MTGLIKKAVGAVLGMALVLGYWTFVGGSGTQTESMDTIPAKVWEGGAGTMQIEIESTSPAQMRISFYERSEEEEAKSVETYEDVPAGLHTWTIDLPANTGGYVELGAVKPKVGDKLSMKVLVNGKVAYEENSTLEQELQPNYAFFVQAHFEDYSRAALGDD
jgi:hypothetical protein